MMEGVQPWTKIHLYFRPRSSARARQISTLWGLSVGLRLRPNAPKIVPLCNGTLQITLHISVSVITNFVIEGATNKQKTRPFFLVYRRRATVQRIPTIHGMVIEEVRPVFAPPRP